MSNNEFVRDHPWASLHFTEIPEEFPVKRPFATLIQGLVYASHLTPEPNAKGLLVWLYGAADSSGNRPNLKSRKVGAAAGRHTLVVSDPSLFLDPELHTGIFLGAEHNDPIDGLITLINAVAISLGLRPEDTIVAGNSGGGFGAVMTVCRTGWRGIALNPQLDLPSFRLAKGAPILLERYRPGATPDQLALDSPHRMNAARAWSLATAKGRQPRLALFQNVVDRYHYKRHYLPFCEMVGAEPGGGLSPDGRIMTTTLDYPGGHGGPVEILEEVIRTGAAFVTT